MSIRQTEFPEFGAAVRGYDRSQVDDYITRLRGYAGDLEDRAAAGEQRAEDLEREVAVLRASERDATAAIPAPAPPPPPPPAAAPAEPVLAGRLARILELAEEEAAEVRAAAQVDADRLRVGLSAEVLELRRARDELVDELGTVQEQVALVLARIGDGRNGGAMSSRVVAAARPVVNGVVRHPSGGTPVAS